MVFIAVGGAFGIYFLAEKIVFLAFGAGFEPAIDVLRWMSFVSILVYLDSAFNLHLIRYRSGFFLILKWCAGIITSVCTYIVMIPKYGSMGAIYGLLAGYVVVCLLGFYKLIAGEVN